MRLVLPIGGMSAKYQTHNTVSAKYKVKTVRILHSVHVAADCDWPEAIGMEMDDITFSASVRLSRLEGTVECGMRNGKRPLLNVR
jgi:hypothetical protein